MSVLPQLTPATELGKLYTEQYAALAGMSEAQFLEGRFGGTLSVEQVGERITDLAAVDDAYRARRILWGRRGLQSSGMKPSAETLCRRTRRTLEGAPPKGRRPAASVERSPEFPGVRPRPGSGFVPGRHFSAAYSKGWLEGSAAVGR